MTQPVFSFRHRIRVRFNEVDRQGIVHNSVPLIYFSVGMGEYYRTLGYDRLAEEKANGHAIHAVHAAVTYRSPMSFDEEIDVHVRVAKMGRTSLSFAYEIHAVSDGRVAATGEQVWVNTDKESHRPTPWTEKFRAAIRAREPALEEAAAPAISA